MKSLSRISGFKRRGLVTIFIIVFLLPGFISGGDGKKGKKIEIELYGGLSTFSPADLNQRVEYDRLYDDYYTIDRYSYYNTLVPDFYTFSGRREGDFNKIKNAMPLGCRLKYNINKSFSISIGVKYLSHRENSQVRYEYQVRNLDPDGVQFHNEFTSLRESSPYSLSVSALAPALGCHYNVALNPNLGFEGFITAGPMFVESIINRERLNRETDQYGYWYQYHEEYEIKGKGTGFSLETGIRLNWGIFTRVNLFLEGVYSFQRAREIKGPGSRARHFSEENGVGYSEVDNWNGIWQRDVGVLDQEWGTKYYRLPTNEYNNNELANAQIDLSGFQVRIGISFAIKH